MTIMTTHSVQTPGAGLSGVREADVRLLRRRVVSVAGSPRPQRCETATAPTLHGSRLTRRGRLVVTLIWVVLLALAVLPFVQSAGGAEPGGRTIPVRIEPGDTLWQVARDAAPEADPRVLVDQIVELNGLRAGSDIRPGDTVQVPVAAG